MLRSGPTFRRLLTAYLTVSFALTLLAPAMIWASAESRSMIGQAPEVDEAQQCCCGSSDGRCCEMTCCAIQPSDSPKNPALPSERTQPQRHSMAGNSSGLSAAVPQSSSRAARTAPEPTLYAISLQKLQVRLDI